MLGFRKKPPAPKSMAEAIKALTEMADRMADQYRQTRAGRTYGTKFHNLAKKLADAQQFAAQEGI